ncbi:2-dehydropantoate 2-reductase [Paenibacillus sp. CAA11]|uniref:ketopantoate reductase family protein n=1 Tax=Paenibacillus sp. CAA11 TaxID=1532905 RepID=UPI000D3886A3|nr:2-dehydropantoate 2-reductase [Paenibacillus sp. CAA11]AWB45379.1 2-dehydropantoate 2-reductase [Paenibacillus sp. CAA11]
MRFGIVGTGALGLLFGAGLAAAGEEVHFWTRTAWQAELLLREGISWGRGGHADQRVHLPGSLFSASPLEENAISEVQPPDWIFLTVKQRDLTEELLQLIANMQDEHTGVVCFQNGYGHMERVEKAMRYGSPYAALTTEGAKRQDGRAVVRSLTGETRLGQVGSRPQPGMNKNAENLTAVLVKAGFPAFLSNDIVKEIYRKLLINAAINPLTALWRIPNGELLMDSERLELMNELIDEALIIYDEYELPYDSDVKEQIMDVCRTTAGNISSMLSDVLQGKATEIDYINGYLVEMARTAGIQALRHEVVWKLVKGLASG